MKTIISSLLLALVATAGVAQEADPYAHPTRLQNEKNWDVILGAAVGSFPEFSGAEDSEVKLLPLVIASYKLSPDNKLFFSPMQGIGFAHRYENGIETGFSFTTSSKRDSKDDAILTGLPDIDRAIEFGPFVEVPLATGWTANADLRMDISDEYGGTRASAGLDYTTPFSPQNPWVFGGGASVQWSGEDYMQTYYGVPAAKALATRPRFEADAGFSDISLKGNASYFFNRQVFVRGDVNVTNLIGDAADSPITREDVNTMGILSVGYRF